MKRYYYNYPPYCLKGVKILKKRGFAVIFIAIILSIAAILFLTLPPVPAVSPIKSTVVATTVSVSPTPLSTLYLDQFGIKGDGTDETTKLQSALDYARDHAIKTVVFPHNKVIFISQNIFFHAGLNVIGNGSTIKREPAAPLSGSMINIMENCHVSGLIVDGSHWDSGSTYEYSDNGVYLYSGVTFTGNEVKNVRAYSIGVYSGSNIQITNNVIHDSYQYGIATGGGTADSHTIIVTGNTITNCKEVGIKIRGTHGATISGNTIIIGSSHEDHDYTVSGIRLYSADNDNENIIIQNNTVEGLDKYYDCEGISSDNSHNTGIEIINNTVSKCGIGISINFNNGIITDNTVSDCGQSIQNTGSGNTVTNNILTN